MRNRNILNILLIEDNPDDIARFNRVLGSITEDVLLTTVQDGILALKILKNGTCNPDVIFLDLEGVSKSDFNILTEIQNDKILKDVPVMGFLSANNLLTLDKYLKLGIRGFVPKSGDISLLSETLQVWVNIQTAKKER